MPIIAIAIAVAVALGGGVSVAANGAHPGDALWGVKTQVNERVQESFAFGEEAKANLDILFAQARLKEAQDLAAEGKLDANAQAQLGGNFDAHATAVKNRIEALQEQGDWEAAADVAARFQAIVAAHASALAQAQASADVNAKPILSAIVSRVESALDVANELSADASVEANAHTSSTSQGSSTDANVGTQTQVHTGTSVQGGQGGIKTDSDTGVQVAI